MSELLPCPFCGGEAKMHSMQVLAPMGFEEFHLECTQCGAKTTHYGSKSEAAQGWNTRAGKTCIRCGAKQVDE